MSFTITPVKTGVHGDLKYFIGDLTFDSYDGGVGESLTPASLGFGEDIYAVNFEPAQGHTFEFDHTNNAVRVTAPVVAAEAAATGAIHDDDNAATAGVQVYVVVDKQDFIPGYALGHFEFVSPTDTDGTCTIATGEAQLTVFDDDAAATNGVAVRAIAASGGLEATLAGSQDPVLVPVSNGKYIKVADSTTGSTPGVYLDEDAAETFERLLAVVVDNADEPYILQEILREAVVQGGVSLTGVSARIHAVGK